jgi:hypothetical protein
MANVNPAETAKFDKLAARWWGEPGLDARCIEVHRAPASDSAGMPRLAPRTRDGSRSNKGT